MLYSLITDNTLNNLTLSILYSGLLLINKSNLLNLKVGYPLLVITLKTSSISSLCSDIANSFKISL